jgi:hypothetical protein
MSIQNEIGSSQPALMSLRSHPGVASMRGEICGEGRREAGLAREPV